MNKTGDQVFVNKNVRYKGKKIPIWDRINRIRNDLKVLLPEIEEDKFLLMASHVRNFFYGKLHYGRRGIKENIEKKRELTKAEKVLLQYYMKNNLNPPTTYRWFVACRLPSDIKAKLQKGQVSFKKAMLIADNGKK